MKTKNPFMAAPYFQNNRFMKAIFVYIVLFAIAALSLITCVELIYQL